MNDGEAPTAESAIDQDALTAEHLRVLASLRRIALDRAKALAGRVALAFEDGRDDALVALSGPADAAERSLRQIILLEDHLAREGAAHRQKRETVERRRAAEARKAEVADRLEAAIDHPEHTRERAERLRLDLRRWLDVHQYDADFLTRALPDQIQRIARTLGVELERTPPAAAPATPAAPTRTDPGPAPRLAERRAQPPLGRAHLLATAARRPP